MSRKTGTQNKLTAESKKIFKDILIGESVNIEMALAELFQESKKDYLNVMSKLLKFAYPTITQTETTITAPKEFNISEALSFVTTDN